MLNGFLKHGDGTFILSFSLVDVSQVVVGITIAGVNFYCFFVPKYGYLFFIVLLVVDAGYVVVCFAALGVDLDGLLIDRNSVIV